MVMNWSPEVQALKTAAQKQSTEQLEQKIHDLAQTIGPVPAFDFAGAGRLWLRVEPKLKPASTSERWSDVRPPKFQGLTEFDELTPAQRVDVLADARERESAAAERELLHAVGQMVMHRVGAHSVERVRVTPCSGNSLVELIVRRTDTSLVGVRQKSPDEAWGTAWGWEEWWRDGGSYCHVVVTAEWAAREHRKTLGDEAVAAMLPKWEASADGLSMVCRRSILPKNSEGEEWVEVSDTVGFEIGSLLVFGGRRGRVAAIHNDSLLVRWEESAPK